LDSKTPQGESGICQKEAKKQRERERERERERGYKN